MVQKRGFSTVLVNLMVVLVAGGAIVGVVIPALRGEAGRFSPGGSVASSVAGITDLLGSLGSEGETFGVAGAGAASSVSPPSTTLLQTTTAVTSTATTYATATSTGTDSNQGSTHNSSPTEATSGQDIEFFSNLTLNVSQPSSSLQKASEIASSLGGYVAYSTYSESVATMTVRVPAQNFQEALGQLESLGTVITASSSSNDVTVQYADLNATLQSLLTEQTSLLKLLGQSNSVNATLNIESVLQKTDAQINSVGSSILETSRLIDYATIGIDFQTSVPRTSVP
ncbi:MAG: DUF4349 domain-containing protein, partial [Nitrososphaerales archaeon]